jgi:hypothetical protein
MNLIPTQFVLDFLLLIMEQEFANLKESMGQVYFNLEVPDNPLVALANFLEKWPNLSRTNHLSKCNELFSFCQRAMAHPHAFAEYLPRISTAVAKFGGFTPKQRQQLAAPKYSSRKGYSNEPEWQPYDGPDDPERYCDGEWDTGDGYSFI